eukprot:3195259-Amphidinium_carterae.1
MVVLVVLEIEAYQYNNLLSWVVDIFLYHIECITWAPTLDTADLPRDTMPCGIKAKSIAGIALEAAVE